LGTEEKTNKPGGIFQETILSLANRRSNCFWPMAGKKTVAFLLGPIPSIFTTFPFPKRSWMTSMPVWISSTSEGGPSPSFMFTGVASAAGVTFLKFLEMTGFFNGRSTPGSDADQLFSLEKPDRMADIFFGKSINASGISLIKRLGSHVVGVHHR
jgi:hypothetical protein